MKSPNTSPNVHRKSVQDVRASQTQVGVKHETPAYVQQIKSKLQVLSILMTDNHTRQLAEIDVDEHLVRDLEQKLSSMKKLLDSVRRVYTTREGSVRSRNNIDESGRLDFYDDRLRNADKVICVSRRSLDLDEMDPNSNENSNLANQNDNSQGPGGLTKHRGSKPDVQNFSKLEIRRKLEEKLKNILSENSQKIDSKKYISKNSTQQKSQKSKPDTGLQPYQSKILAKALQSRQMNETEHSNVVNISYPSSNQEQIQINHQGRAKININLNTKNVFENRTNIVKHSGSPGASDREAIDLSSSIGHSNAFGQIMTPRGQQKYGIYGEVYRPQSPSLIHMTNNRMSPLSNVKNTTGKLYESTKRTTNIKPNLQIQTEGVALWRNSVANDELNGNTNSSIKEIHGVYDSKRHGIVESVIQSSKNSQKRMNQLSSLLAVPRTSVIEDTHRPQTSRAGTPLELVRTGVRSVKDTSRAIEAPLLFAQQRRSGPTESYIQGMTMSPGDTSQTSRPSMKLKVSVRRDGQVGDDSIIRTRLSRK